METSITKLLKIEYPILQGAMAWIAEHNLAAATSNAGGLGIIASGNAPTEIIREEIIKTKALTAKPFAVNIMLLSPYAKEIAEMVIEEKVPIITTGAGNPGPYMEKWKENGMLVIPVVPSVALAVRMEKQGADAIIVEGTEAGGHIGELTTMVLTPQVVDAVNIPVIAAGGIGDGRGLIAAMALGANGVQIGTRFLVAKECICHEKYKEKVLSAKDRSTVVSGRSTGHPVRAIKNKLTRTFDKLEKEDCNPEKLDILGQGKLRAAVVDGDIVEGSIMAGQIAGMINKEQSCEEIIQEIINEAKGVCGNLYNL